MEEKNKKNAIAKTNGALARRWDDFWSFNLDPFFRTSEKLLRTMAYDNFFQKAMGDYTGNVPLANIEEKEKEFILSLAAPGMKKEDFNIQLQQQELSITAKRVEERTTQEKQYTRREFNYTTFQRSFILPDTVDPANIKAAYKDGILSIHLPKKAGEQLPAATSIEVE